MFLATFSFHREHTIQRHKWKKYVFMIKQERSEAKIEGNGSVSCRDHRLHM